ncbi:MAG: hypothetical protein ACRC33_28205 [Gemmataceae bacterium]
MSVQQPTEVPTFPPYLDERELKMLDDYEWATWDPGVQSQYPGQFVAVHDRQVLGAGSTQGDAIRAAMQHPSFPGRDRLAKVYVHGVLPLGGPR